MAFLLVYFHADSLRCISLANGFWALANITSLVY